MVKVLYELSHAPDARRLRQKGKFVQVLLGNFRPLGIS
jgi:hypothetical protein